MRKRLFIFLMAVLVIAGLASCRDEAGTATMKLLLKKTDVVPKTFIPANTVDLRVARYTIHGNGPDNGSFDVSTDSPSVTINGLAVGSWSITATGVNPAGVSLIQGSESVALGPDTGTTTIVLDQMVGSGTLVLDVDWVNTEVDNPVLELFYRPQGGEEEHLEFDADYGNRTANARATLAAGSYIIRGVLKSGDFQIGGFVETARLVGGQTTSGTVSISQMRYADTSAYFHLDDRLGEPVRGELSGFDEAEDDGLSLPADTDKRICFTLDGDFRPTPDFQIQWFLDGIEQGSPATLGGTNEQSFNVSPGSHRIDAVVNNNLLGSYGSVSATFEALSTGEAGSLSKLNDFAQLLIGRNNEGENLYITLGADTIVSPLPGGKFLVVSPASEKILILKPARNYVEVRKVFDEARFPYVGAITNVKSDGVLPWVVAQDGPGSLAFLRYDPETDELAEFGDGGLGRIDGPFVAGATQASFGRIHGIGFNPTSGTIHVGDAAFKIDGNDPSSVLTYFKVDQTSGSNKVVYVGKDNLGQGFADGCEFSISPSGYCFAATLSGSSQIIVGEMFNDGGVYTYDPYGGLAGNANHVFMVDDSLILASGTTLQSLNIGASASEWQSLGVKADLVVANGTQTCVYSLDKTGRTVSAFSRNTGGAALTQIGGNCVITTNAGESLTGMALSGSYLLVSSTSGKLSLCRVL